MNSLWNNLLGHHGDGNMTVETILLRLLTTFVLAHVVTWVYVRTHRGISYSASLAQSLVVLALIVSLVMMIVGNNVARAFGLFGALALIRFRTPIKDTRDTVYLFLAVAIGIATGTGNLAAGVVGTIVIGLCLHYLASSRVGNRLDHNGLLRFCLPSGDDGQDLVDDVLGRYCSSYNLLNVREAGTEETLELSFEIQMNNTDDGVALVNDIKRIAGTSRFSLLMQDEEAMP